ncbi:HAD family hydrolase [Mucilaginibacter sp.]|jgi:phosphoglycolate phosphatase|uniref:HAD family hydrolase n=1 Tax=Mucilaginibacter sp. TaxID=1882438 RepID=UPI002B71B5EC|nr:HAD family hydrolase [Mucilaginibacter sp.]HTI58555.1 HAD family hydrolase [Mucilaginibacter sp.]
MLINKPDSLIFDMDGTLWDAVDTYAESWNIVFQQLGIDMFVRRDDLAKMVGWEGKKVHAVLMPDFDEEKRQGIYAKVNELRRELLPKNGGVLYGGVKDGLKQLAGKYQLYIVSNCAVGIIRLFMDWAGISENIVDEIAYGTNYMPKHYNIKQLIERHHLKTPVYVGDTEGDGEQSRLAGIPFVFVSYGFGNTNDHDVRFDNFTDLTNYFMGL